MIDDAIYIGATHPELRFEKDNLVTLCRPCHHDAHRKGVS